MYRRNRRSRLWHRKPGFDVNTNREGWLAPSIKHKLDSHIRFINKITDILPITKIVIEVANFDIQKIKNPDIKGKQYQEGEQKGYDNLRAYILHRDNYRCQNPDCKNKQAQPELHVHHIQYRINGGPNRPDNLITLCRKCHTPKNHKGFLLTWKPKVRGFKDATFMNMVKWKLVEILKENHVVDVTYGYLTKEKRYELGLDKTHANDAFCIANGMNQVRHNPYEIRQIRRNNRSLSMFYDAKYIDSRDKSLKTGTELYSGRTTRNKKLNTENLRKYRLIKVNKGKFNRRKSRPTWHSMDLVEYNEQKEYIKGSHNHGTRVILKSSGKSVAVSKIKNVKYGMGLCWVDPKIHC